MVSLLSMAGSRNLSLLAKPATNIIELTTMDQRCLTRVGHDTSLSALATTNVRHFLIGEILNIHVPFGMFDSHTNEMSIAIEFDQNILVDVACLSNFFLCEIYEQSIRVRKILHLHHE